MSQWIALLVALAVAAAYRWPALQWQVRPLERRAIDLLRRPAIGWLAAAAFSLVINAQLALHRGMPEPVVQDEFSYLLAADTFSHGRLTNATHPLWHFFETFHELQRPTYMSKYPPGQGLMLALGQVITGQPILGAWVEAALLTFSVGWMLYGFVPAAPSVLGAFVAASLMLVLRWSQSYWGGCLAATGGCLVMGAWARLYRARRWRPGVALGIGLFILAITRPYEGLLFSVPFVLWGLSRPRQGVLAAGIVLTIGAAWLLYDNARVTGHPLLLPYTAYERQYALAPPFLWEQPRPNHPFDRPIMQAMALGTELPHYYAQRTLTGFCQIAWIKLCYLWNQIADPWALAIPLLWAPGAIAADRRLRYPLGAALLVLAGTLASNWTRTQYIAPALPVLVLLWVAGLHRAAGQFPAVSRGLAVGILTGMVASALAFARTPATRTQRDHFEQELLGVGGKHLVFVQYLPGHWIDDEWVYNAAEIDASPIVWAADRGWVEDQQLIRYFAGRVVWHCTVDAKVARFERVEAVPDPQTYSQPSSAAR